METPSNSELNEIKLDNSEQDSGKGKDAECDPPGNGNQAETPQTTGLVNTDEFANSSENDANDSEREESSDPPPQPLKELVRIYLEQANDAELKEASKVASIYLGAICNSQQYDPERLAADYGALGRARWYLRTLKSSNEDIDTILGNAKAKAQVSAAPAASGHGWRNSVGASSAMYLVTFFMGKWLTASIGIGLLFNGPVGSVALATLANALAVPLTQVLAGDPMGGALRNYGPNVPSEDSRQYAAFMTAHALYMRAHVAGTHAALAPQFAMEMDRAINAVVWREQGRPGTATGKPLFIASGVDPIIDPGKPKAEVDAALRGAPYSKAQRYKVVACMLARILLSDELPVHTFTLLNGVTGYLNTLWPALFGASTTGLAISRAVDAAAHTGSGLFAMYFMFVLQDWIRPMVQGVGPTDPTNQAYIEDKTTPKLIELTQDQARLSAVFLVENALNALRGRLKKALKAPDLKDSGIREHLGELHKQCKELCAEYGKFSEDVGKRTARTQDDIRALTSATGAISRMVLDTCRVVTGRTGHTSGKSWTDGSPSVVRGFSKCIAYVSALAPVTAMSIVTGRAIGASLQAAKVVAAQTANAVSAASVSAGTSSTNIVVPSVMPDDVTLTRSEIEGALKPYAAASGTTAMVAILGWNTRNVLFDPLYQHVIHAGIGVVERLAASCALADTPEEASDATKTTTMPTEIVGGNDRQEASSPGGQSGTERESGSESLSSESTGQDAAPVPLSSGELHQIVQDMQALDGSVFGDVWDPRNLEAAWQEIMSLRGELGLQDQTTSSSDRS